MNQSLLPSHCPHCRHPFVAVGGLHPKMCHCKVGKQIFTEWMRQNRQLSEEMKEGFDALAQQREQGLEERIIALVSLIGGCKESELPAIYAERHANDLAVLDYQLGAVLNKLIANDQILQVVCQLPNRSESISFLLPKDTVVLVHKTTDRAFSSHKGQIQIPPGSFPPQTLGSVPTFCRKG